MAFLSSRFCIAFMVLASNLQLMWVMVNNYTYLWYGQVVFLLFFFGVTETQNKNWMVSKVT